MILSGTRHISHDFYSKLTAYPPVPALYQELNSIKSISLNKNKYYQIKNLNIITKNTNGYSSLQNGGANLIFSNDENFLNNISQSFINTYTGVINSFTYKNSNGSSFTFPFPNNDFIDIESTLSRGLQSLTKNVLNKIGSPSLTFFFWRTFELVNSFSGLLRKIPISLWASGDILYSNYIVDFSFYNNLSDRLTIFCYWSGYQITSGLLEINGTVDFDLLEFEPED